MPFQLFRYHKLDRFDKTLIKTGEQIMVRYTKHLRLLLIFAAIIALVFLHWISQVRIGFWQDDALHEWEMGTWKFELALRKQLTRELEEPFLPIISKVKQFAGPEMDELGFANWLRTDAVKEPLVGAGLLWQRGDDKLKVIASSMEIKASHLEYLKEYIDLEYHTEHNTIPRPKWINDSLKILKKQVSENLGYSIFVQEFTDLKTKSEKIIAINTIFIIVWNHDYFQKEILPSNMEQVTSNNYEYLLWDLFGKDSYCGIFIENANQDTIYSWGKVQRSPYIQLFDETNNRAWSAELRHLPNWRIFVQNHQNYWSIDKYERMLERNLSGLQEELAAAEMIKYDQIRVDRSSIWLNWMFLGLSIGVLFLFLLVQVLARKRQRDFIAHISHELLTPISKVKLFAETLRNDRTVSEEKEDEYLDNILHASDHLEVLVDNTLNLARIDADKFEVIPTTNNISEWLKAFYESQVHWLNESGFTSTLNIDPDLPSLSFDKQALELALRNSLDNAVKYSDKTKEIELSAKLKDSQNVVIVVNDRGLGIPTNKRKAIFKRFYRVTQKDREPVGGVGLGLSIVKEIIKAHHGKVYCEGRDGGGTSFIIELKIKG